MTPRPDDLPREWLAAYADGELCPPERARVEQWLAENPEARDLLEAQEALGPTNAEFWDAVRPPAPAPGAWAETARAFTDRTASRPARRWAGWLGTIGLMATAATLLLALPAIEPPPARFPPA